MLPSESPFPCHWWGIGLEEVGLGDMRPDLSTYGRYAFEQLPPVPFEMRGDLAWLANASAHDQNIGNENAAKIPSALALLREASARLGVRLPGAFTTFMETATLHRRIRSNTDCFLDLCTELIRSPIGTGYLVRFLADSQGCIFWYLYLTSDGSDHAVVSSPGFYGTAAEQWQEEAPDAAEVVFSAESFELFMCRFWLENEIWFAEYQRTPMPDVGREYIDRYRSKRA